MLSAEMWPADEVTAERLRVKVGQPVYQAAPSAPGRRRATRPRDFVHHLHRLRAPPRERSRARFPLSASRQLVRYAADLKPNRSSRPIWPARRNHACSMFPSAVPFSGRGASPRPGATNPSSTRPRSTGATSTGSIRAWCAIRASRRAERRNVADTLFHGAPDVAVFGSSISH